MSWLHPFYQWNIYMYKTLSFPESYCWLAVEIQRCQIPEKPLPRCWTPHMKTIKKRIMTNNWQRWGQWTVSSNRGSDAVLKDTMLSTTTVFWRLLPGINTILLCLLSSLQRKGFRVQLGLHHIPLCLAIWTWLSRLRGETPPCLGTFQF